MEPIISVLNLKNGVGVSSLVWNVAHILELDIYQHDKAMHHLFNKERDTAIEDKKIISNSVSVNPIDKREFKSGVYDLGADINYGYVRQIISRSKVVVIPIEVGAEVLIKTIATIQYVAEHNEECDIFVVFNKLDNSDPKRERKYTKLAEDKIDEMNSVISKRIIFYHIRYSFAMFRNVNEGNFLLDNFISSNANKIKVSNFRLLQHLRYGYLREKIKKSEVTNKEKKIEELTNEEKKKEENKRKEKNFVKDHKSFYEEFEKIHNIPTLFDAKFIDNNKKIIKDMLILATGIKGNYSFIWEEKYV